MPLQEKHRILITGANSYFGRRLYKEFSDKGHHLVGTFAHNNADNLNLRKLDVTKQEQLFDLITKIKPQIIVHNAANPGFIWNENNPIEAKLLNETAPIMIADIARKFNIKLIFISACLTDNPTDRYAIAKKNAEEYIRRLDGLIYNIIRPNRMIGCSPNTTSPRYFNNILRMLYGKDVFQFDNVASFQPTYIRHPIEVMLMLIDNNMYGNTIYVAVPEQKTEYEIARDILNHFNVKVGTKPVLAGQNSNPTLTGDLRPLNDLGLPEYTYPQILDATIKEIKQT